MVFYADPPRAPGILPVARGEAVGSAMWIGKAGYVATCYHVLKDWTGPFKVGFARSAFVNESGLSISLGPTINIWAADLVAFDIEADVAILKAGNRKPETEHARCPGDASSGGCGFANGIASYRSELFLQRHKRRRLRLWIW